MTSAERLVLVDGSSSLYRAFFALPPLSTSGGIPTNGTLGFTNMLLKLLREENPDAVAVAFDGPGPTVRHREFADYKAQRPETPESLLQQIPYVHRMLEGMRVPILMMPSEEADDILGSVAVRGAAEGHRVVLISGDKDLFQLVGERIVVRDTMKERTWGPAEVQERYGISPGQFPDLLALMGDSIDNIPGVPGVGEKTARDLLQRFGTLEGVLEHIGEISKRKLGETLRTHAEQARLSKRLATIRTHLPVPWSPADLRRKRPDAAALISLFQELGFSRLVQQFSQGQFDISD
jgi:5'-3' exonuclease